MMDYKKELERLKQQKAELGGDFWKPEARLNQYKVKALGELEDADPYEEEGQEPKPRKQLKILVEGKQYVWNMNFGKTPSSVYGQLVNLASVKGKLKDEEFGVIVVGSGQEIRFTIAL